ncbi:PAS domain-containing sensor histidine kinase [Wenyingzhuangia sp. IMCC45467]
MKNSHDTNKELKAKIIELQKENKALKLTILNKNKEKLSIQNILNNIGVPIFVKDNQSRLIIVNNALCDVFKKSRDEIIGKTLAEDVLPEERESFLKIDKQVLADGIENINIETLTIEGGKTKIISTRKTRFVTNNNEKFIVGIIHDITQSFNTEANLKKSKIELQKLNETKNKLFSILAHDLRSPFSNIVGISELLIHNPENFDYDLKKYIKVIHSSAKSTLTLVDNLLNWSISQTNQICFNPEKIHLSQVFLEVINLKNPVAIVKKISLKHFTSPSETIIYADKNMLMIILRNLVTNAIKFTNNNGLVNLLSSIEKNYVKITISDNGVGISKEKIDKIFNVNPNKNSVGTANEQGFGLGLLICKEFVEKHKGKIWVESELNKGSLFHFTLPLNN